MKRVVSKPSKRRGIRKIPKDAKLIPNIPECDYFSTFPGVYYHFTKMEWRTTCKDPVVNSKRWQRTFGIKKYGFYEAKLKAEIVSMESNRQFQLSKFANSVGNYPNNGDNNAETRYFNPVYNCVPQLNAGINITFCPYCLRVLNGNEQTFNNFVVNIPTGTNG
ncbi:hypothetical protein BEWA_019340 [Theileria equi strain WA]|uniref:AP2/ERF domain-containing protein n=1 Tax=Theileria equi strain WA TaxID=1537102 RepID=L0AW14_THEEQ|nr:hypothetical protein BEWA_019340 [Theileria equi strain WA]AFZ79089.1 hypothetical protein BEWA_019340 [Theileria equi strain WA]|eukprot:XP_004828755.1 hypothetical protein BEWA_019340 [Theileria equi strain WA]